MPVKLDANALAAQYGYAATFFYSVPELRRLLTQAVAGQWTAEQFGAKFMNTAWYKWQTESYKEWTALVAKNPGEANKRVNERAAVLSDQAQRLGLTLDAVRLQKMARDSLIHNWDEGTLKRALAAEMKYKPQQGGDIGAEQSKIREMSAAYGIQLAEKDVFSLSQKMIAGQMTEDGIGEYVKNLAKSRYPGLVDEIDKGLSLREVASAYVQSQSKILEINPDQIDLATDRNLQKALQYVDPATGKPGGAMPLWQYEQQLRQDSRWLATNNAHEEMTNVGTKVLKDMGLLS